ncbi:hypothetical protein [Acidovorax sp.]|uniref:hypothetical protein n=1 Tax=Acidovorax sp. TaxID=1872122 RepID=UPI0025C07DEA|nr:hypothetical protein [Acidovorax sp.]MBW8463348.1 hypothetical protein [Acidovorax sp.]
MTNPTPPGQVPASSAVLKAIREANMQLVRTGDDAFMLVPYLQAHVQNPAEIEHVAGDVSKNGVETNMSTQQPAPAGATPDATWCAYVAGMICTYLKEDADGAKAKAIAGIIERRLMFLAVTPQPTPAAGVTVEQVEDAIGLQSTAWDTIGAEKIVEAVLRLTNGQAPATQQAGVVLSDDLRDRLVAISEAIADQDDRAAQAMLREILEVPQADSQPAPVAAFEVADAIADSQYLAGVSAGWNAANADDPNAALQKLHESRAGYLKPLRAARAPADSVLEDAADPLQGAANWLAEAHGQFCVAVLQGCLMIGYNRAKRLHDVAIAARKQGANHD